MRQLVSPDHALPAAVLLSSALYAAAQLGLGVPFLAVAGIALGVVWAVEAALTGHQVLSTMHCNDAAGAIARLDDMGIAPFLISSSVILSCAQRLMRRICPSCKETLVYPAARATAALHREGLRHRRGATEGVPSSS